MKQAVKITISIIACEMVGFLSGLATASSVPGWYASLAKPAFSPPNWVFGPVWIFLYMLMGLAAALVWTKDLKTKGVKIALGYFLIQLFLNFLWSIFFFGFKLPLLSFVDIVLLWVFIALTILNFMKISKLAGYLMLPYILWVSFAVLLNFSIIILNR